MSCSLDAHPMLFPASTLSGDSFSNVCVATNITQNAAAQSLLASCCGSASVTTIIDGCYSYCNITGSAAQDSWKTCFSQGSASQGLDYACEDGSDPFDSIVPLSASAGSTYLDGSSGTLVFPASTSTSGPASGSATATTTGAGSTATGNATATGASGTATAKESSTGKSGASATSSGASPSSTANAGSPTVKQFSKGAVAVLALAFVGFLA